MDTIIEEFEAVGADGTLYNIIIWQEWHDVGTVLDPNAKAAGLKRIATFEGLNVNRLDSDTFEVVQTNEIIRRLR